MKKAPRIVLIVLLLLLVVGYAMPTGYNLSQSIQIDAPAAKVHELVGELKRWDDWTPWKTQDPTVDVSLGELTTGVGAYQSWTADEGGGELTFTKCDAASGVTYDMNFIQDGEKSPCVGWISYVAKDGGTEVTWGMEGSIDMPFGGVIKLLVTSSIKEMFGQGLSALKVEAEKDA